MLKYNEMENIKIKTVADFVVNNIHTANVFKKYGIDFCFDGKISIKKACLKNDVDYEHLKHELNDLDIKTNFLNDFNKWGLDFLMIFIIHIHHRYVKMNIPILKIYGDKAVKNQGKEYKELLEINKLIIKFSDELIAHMKKEETIVFPFIKALFNANKEHTTISLSSFDSLNHPIKMMEEYHDKAGDILKQISKLSNKYNAPEDASLAFKKLYNKLQEFEDNLYNHVHLENNILFPKAKKLVLEVVK
jgi:regulator of cell morphogenesis and NO signaling